jgi:hypothetical protein
MTKQSHLAHIMIASSDGYFLNTIYNDSKLKKCSKFYNVDYLPKEDVIANDNLWAKDTHEEDEELLRDMVTNNILYFDPTRAVYYPQGKSYHHGIRLYFEE